MNLLNKESIVPEVPRTLGLPPAPEGAKFSILSIYKWSFIVSC
jgi:hypothetical protein